MRGEQRTAALTAPHDGRRDLPKHDPKLGSVFGISITEIKLGAFPKNPPNVAEFGSSTGTIFGTSGSLTWISEIFGMRLRWLGHLILGALRAPKLDG